MSIDDRASEQETLWRAIALAHRKPEAPATGECLCCGETMSAGRRWCDAVCRDDWERLQRARR
ncbi:hypothetical protein SAMN02745857_02803 [Andreprevotia lacus DSM 23236]|jgi:hypothetical protein|uniref:DUF2116 family Zn-ribbon domain-containing protein n=1 Tax=Andreprevotia lacus DSM 23236 TaxID=1121001 RepID=A0A1W1XTU0_9NEIS|nr:hypothetical protein [Andreprevotia lacus]SMC27306.1 hypothetical protein SAMN02745857_02803 [Andreprevotia lacus DSM 23236]